MAKKAIITNKFINFKTAFLLIITIGVVGYFFHRIGFHNAMLTRQIQSQSLVSISPTPTTTLGYTYSDVKMSGDTGILFQNAMDNYQLYYPKGWIKLQESPTTPHLEQFLSANVSPNSPQAEQSIRFTINTYSINSKDYLSYGNNFIQRIFAAKAGDSIPTGDAAIITKVADISINGVPAVKDKGKGYLMGKGESYSIGYEIKEQDIIYSLDFSSYNQNLIDTNQSIFDAIANTFVISK